MSVLIFSRKQQAPAPRGYDDQQTRVKSVILQYPTVLIASAEKLGIDVHAEKTAVEQAYALADAADVHHVAREVLVSVADKIIAQLINDMKKRTIVTEEIEHMLRSAKAEYMIATPESMTKADGIIRMASEKAGDVKRQATDTKRRLDGIIDRISSKPHRSDRMKVHHERTMKGVEEAIDMLLDDKIASADTLTRSISEDYVRLQGLQERARHAVDKAMLLIQQISEIGFNPEVSKMEEILISSKVLLDAEEFEGAYTAANSIVYLAKGHIPESMLQPWDYVCPICFSETCPECELKINGAVKCHLGCACGTGYHLCCISRHANFPCVSCERVLNKKTVTKHTP
jgi:hypothetical protein